MYACTNTGMIPANVGHSVDSGATRSCSRKLVLVNEKRSSLQGLDQERKGRVPASVDTSARSFERIDFSSRTDVSSVMNTCVYFYFYLSFLFTSISIDAGISILNVRKNHFKKLILDHEKIKG